MNSPDSGTAVGHTETSSNDGSGTSLIRLQLTLWLQYL